jgi:ABC-type oligopeptide transport system ATPase subunit
MPLTLRAVSHRYRDGLPWVVRGVDLEVADGESVALMGPSGSGKTTILSVLGLLTRPAEGEVLLDGKLVAWRHASELRTAQFSWVFQTANALLRRSAIDNAALQLIARGAQADAARSTAIAELERVGVGTWPNGRRGCFRAANCSGCASRGPWPQPGAGSSPMNRRGNWTMPPRWKWAPRSSNSGRLARPSSSPRTTRR